MKVNTLATSWLCKNVVKNHKHEVVGSIREVIVDLDEGKIAYVILSLDGLVRMADKFIAVPWSNLTMDQENKCCFVNMSKEHLETSPGFDKHHWPLQDDIDYLTKVYDYHKVIPFWSEV